MPKLIVAYVVGLGIEFTVAQWKKEEIQEGFLVTGFLIPLIVPVDTPLWMIAVATAMSVIFAKEVFGGTGYNIFNVALITRAILFFAYPTMMTGDSVFVRTSDSFGVGAGTLVDGYSGATPLGQIATAGESLPALHNIVNEPLSLLDAFWGFIPGSIGEVSTLAILLGAALLIWMGIASWKIRLYGSHANDTPHAPFVWRLCLWYCFHGNGPRNLGTYRNREVDLWILCRGYVCLYPRTQPRVS